MDDADLIIETERPTLARFDRACEAAGLRPDDVRQGDAAIVVPAGCYRDVMDVIAPRTSLPADYEEQVMHQLVQTWFAEAAAMIESACDRADVIAERLGVTSLLKGGGSTSLLRVLVKEAPSDYVSLYTEAGLEDAMTFLLVRGVESVSENFEDHLASTTLN